MIDRLLIKSTIVAHSMGVFEEQPDGSDEDGNPRVKRVKVREALRLARGPGPTYQVNRKLGTLVVTVDGVSTELPIPGEAYEKRDAVMTTELTVLCPRALIPATVALLNTREVSQVSKRRFASSLFANDAGEVFAVVSFRCTGEFARTLRDKRAAPSKSNLRFRSDSVVAKADALLQKTKRVQANTALTKSVILFAENPAETDDLLSRFGLKPYKPAREEIAP